MNMICFDYHAIAHFTDEERCRLLKTLPPAKYERLRVYTPQRLNEALSADLLARKLCALLPGSPVPDCLPNGAPSLPASGFCLSLAHSGHYAAAAVSDLPIGIDIEALRPLSDRLFRRVLTETEYLWVRTQPDPSAAFMQLWTMREAYGKLRQTGIFTSDDFEAAFHQMRLNTVYPGFRFFFPACPDGYFFSICHTFTDH